MSQISRKLDRSPQTKANILVLCQECQTGKMHLQHLTYFTWLNDELITAPNFPAWVCDVCGKREYDPRAVVWLNALLNPDAGKRKALRRRAGYSGADQAQP
ncbi:MAG TPA: YgiT-type zinc finger protein [Anaerolineales bacterium]|nr:YgiT-type zinc finger protein [Anaerolineales bacterium]